VWNRGYWDLRLKRRETMKQKHSKTQKKGRAIRAAVKAALLSSQQYYFTSAYGHATWGVSNRIHVMQPLRWDVWEGAFRVAKPIKWQLLLKIDDLFDLFVSEHWPQWPQRRAAAWCMHKIMQATQFHNLINMSLWHSPTFFMSLIFDYSTYNLHFACSDISKDQYDKVSAPLATHRA